MYCLHEFHLLLILLLKPIVPALLECLTKQLFHVTGFAQISTLRFHVWVGYAFLGRATWLVVLGDFTATCSMIETVSAVLTHLLLNRRSQARSECTWWWNGAVDGILWFTHFLGYDRHDWRLFSLTLSRGHCIFFGFIFLWLLLLEWAWFIQRYGLSVNATHVGTENLSWLLFILNFLGILNCRLVFWDWQLYFLRFLLLVEIVLEDLRMTICFLEAQFLIK